MINVNNISEFHVSNLCMESHPCQHKCWFVFADGKPQVSVVLYKDDIKGYLSKIDKDKIYCSYRHFRDAAPSSRVSDDSNSINKRTPASNNNPLLAGVDVSQVSHFDIGDSADEAKYKCSILVDNKRITKMLSKPETDQFLNTLFDANFRYE